MRHGKSRQFPAVVALLTVLAVSPAISVTADELQVAPLTLVTGPTPFTPGCNGAPQSGEVFPNAEVEPWVALNPTNPANLVGVEGVDTVVLGGDEHHVVNPLARNVHVRHVERLRVDVPVHRI